LINDSIKVFFDALHELFSTPTHDRVSEGPVIRVLER
jgi:hypothetical protein